MKVKNNIRFIEVLNSGIFFAKVMFSYKMEYDDIVKELKKQKQKGWLQGLEMHKDLFDEGAKYFACRSKVKEEDTERLFFYLVYNQDFKFEDDCYVRLAHECLHLCQFILPDFLNRDREYECEAYLHGHFMTQALDAIRKNLKK